MSYISFDVASMCRHHIHRCIWFCLNVIILMYALLLLIAEAVLNEEQMYGCFYFDEISEYVEKIHN